MLSSSCLVIWHAVDPNPITRAGEVTREVVRDNYILERTPVLAALLVTIKAPRKPCDAIKTNRTERYDNPTTVLTTEIPIIF